MWGSCTSSFLAWDGFAEGEDRGICGAGMVSGASVSGEAHGDEAGSGSAGAAGDYRCVFE